MKKAELKIEIEATAKTLTSYEAGKSELELITAMQAQCAKVGDEKTLSILCEIKWDYINN